MQSARGKSKSWIIECVLPSARKPESLMGWISSEDTLNQLRLKFDTAEDAVCYAKKYGWDYTVQPEHARKIKPRNYGDNFRYTPAAEE